MRPLLKSVAGFYAADFAKTKDRASTCHPGLWLDKAATPGKQEDAKPDIEQVIELHRLAKTSGGDVFAQASEARGRMLGQPAFTLATSSPLAIHLARASALENAGLCLHPAYGFPYLPGSGLKGLTHAFASLHSDSPKADIEAVFGKTDSAGAIVFHDAWPAEWPELILDIVNCHHRDYYSAPESNVPPPGDWENPVPVYFPAVKPGAKFQFHLAPREAFAAEHPDEARRLLALARQWLASGLHHLGAGAKTNAGYGRFEASKEIVVLPLAETTATFDCTLELVTPAFLAGAKQEQEDCDLRPATLRGLLRWWWRTMHAHALNPKDLRRLENVIWGSAEHGGAIGIKTSRLTEIPQDSNDPCGQYKLDKRSLARDQKLPEPPNRKTTQGMSYLAFGMDDNVKEKGQTIRRQRYWLAPRHRWALLLTARSIHLNGETISATTILSQTRASLDLLTTFGGVGSKAGKGWGSIVQTPNNPAFKEILENVRSVGMKLRVDLGLSQQTAEASTPSIESEVSVLEIHTLWKNPWYAIDRLGACYQAFCQQRKHNIAKKALGLPRRIGAPATGTFRPSGKLGEFLDKAEWRKKDEIRHPAPFLFHFDRKADETLVLRAIFLPSRVLPDFNASKTMLRELKTHLENSLNEEIKKNKGGISPQTPKVLGTSPSFTLGPILASPARVQDPEQVLFALHPPKNYRAQEKGMHQKLIDALSDFKKNHTDQICAVCKTYLDAIYTIPKDDKKYKKDKLYMFLVEHAPRT